MKTLLAHWKSAFLTGLAVVLPGAVSIGIVVWLFGTAASFTDALLLLVPRAWTHAQNGEGAVHLYWRVIALVLAILLVGLIGRGAGEYLGRRMIRLADDVLMRVPLLNKIYGALKQINEAFTSSRTAAFKQVVLVEFPRAGLYSLGFVTSTQNGQVQARFRESMLSVFVPAPPLTSGAIVLVPETEVVRLDMSVSDGIKFIMSLGSVCPACPSQEGAASAGPSTNPKPDLLGDGGAGCVPGVHGPHPHGFSPPGAFACRN
jgi:uncharacterized membrane protein